MWLNVVKMWVQCDWRWVKWIKGRRTWSKMGPIWPKLDKMWWVEGAVRLNVGTEWLKAGEMWWVRRGQRSPASDPRQRNDSEVTDTLPRPAQVPDTPPPWWTSSQPPSWGLPGESRGHVTRVNVLSCPFLSSLCIFLSLGLKDFFTDSI